MCVRVLSGIVNKKTKYLNFIETHWGVLKIIVIKKNKQLIVKMKVIYTVGFIFLTAIVASAQTQTLTNTNCKSSQINTNDLYKQTVRHTDRRNSFHKKTKRKWNNFFFFIVCRHTKNNFILLNYCLMVLILKKKKKILCSFK